jgi:predicted naringenin-chalcone synthase
LPQAYLNAIATAVPPHEVHAAFAEYQRFTFRDARKSQIFDRLVERGQILRRWSCLMPANDARSAWSRDGQFYAPGRFPTTAERMRLYEVEAPELAISAVQGLDLGARLQNITHLIITSCTGFSAPGIDLELVKALGLKPSVERTMVGFMGCYAAINGLKLARHIVRSEPSALVLLVSVELCTLHFQETEDLEYAMPFMLFADGAAAALISAEERGACLESFSAALLPSAREEMAWFIRDGGFEMVLSSRVPNSVSDALQKAGSEIFKDRPSSEVELWAVHPGGRAVLDAVEEALKLPKSALDASRAILRNFGNMSSATVLFVLELLMQGAKGGEKGCAMSFGPGLTAETMQFRIAG